MVEDILRFSREIDASELADVIAGRTKVPLEMTGNSADLAPMDSAIERLIRGSKKLDTRQCDMELSPLLHQALKDLPRPAKLDMRMWHWFSIIRFPVLVWGRWNGEQPSDIDAALAKGGLAARFLGNRSLRGRHRNALARLFFTAEMLYDAKEGYRLVGSAFQMQDRHTSLFEREMGLLPATARALIRLTQGMDSKEIQKMAKRLNHIGSTLVFEVMEERELRELLS
jgi:hypothetical protein